MSKDSNCLAAFSILPGLDFSGAASEPVTFSAMSCALDSGSMAAILNHFQLGFESAGGAQILQNGNDVARRRSDGGQRAHQFLAWSRPASGSDCALSLLSRPRATCGTTSRGARTPAARAAKRRRWSGFRRSVAVHDGHRRDVHIAAHHDGSGALIDDDACRAVGVHGHFFQLGNELDGARGIVRRESTR